MKRTSFTAALSAPLDLLFPARCLRCGLPSRRQIDLCAGCEAELVPLAACCQLCAEPMADGAICGRCLKTPPDFSRIVAPFRYQPPLDLWILRFKGHGDLRTGRVLALLLARHLSEHHPFAVAPDLVVPAPLHWRRRLHRGFNQSHELARIAARELALPFAPGILKRVKHTPQQQALSRGDRLRNLRTAFVADRRCRDCHIAVVDDVVTTASTARAIASELMGAGAASVQLWAVARTALEN